MLATIPREAFVAGESGSRTEAAFPRLRDIITFLSAERRPDTIAIVSPLDGQGKTTVAIRLALSYARAGRRVVLIDADLRRPTVATRIGVPDAPGLSDVISGQDLSSAIHPIEGLAGELSVLPAGRPPPNPAEILGARGACPLCSSGSATTTSSL